MATTLWPYAMQLVVEHHNQLSLHKEGRSPIEIFAGTDNEIDANNFHIWDCLVYILDEANQGAIDTPK